MVDIRHKVGIKAPIEKVFQALCTEKGLANWWTLDTKADTRKGGKIEFSFEKRLDKEYDVQVEITELVEGRTVAWKVLNGPEEWMGTQISFDLQEDSEKVTVVDFKHTNWKNTTDFMIQCNTKWAVFLLSLKDLVETGHGKPFPNDIRIGYNGA